MGLVKRERWQPYPSYKVNDGVVVGRADELSHPDMVPWKEQHHEKRDDRKQELF